jgi:hypothetical protein
LPRTSASTCPPRSRPPMPGQDPDGGPGRNHPKGHRRRLVQARPGGRGCRRNRPCAP